METKKEGCSNSNGPSEAIERFITKHHVLTLSTSVNDEVWCAHCFYVYDAESVSFFFNSSAETLHAQQMSHNSFVAASIVLESSRVGMLRGLQMQGLVNLPEGEELARAKSLYLRRFPIARMAELMIWQLKVTHMKYTDNRLGFGKKEEWNEMEDFVSLLNRLSVLGKEEAE